MQHIRRDRLNGLPARFTIIVVLQHILRDRPHGLPARRIELKPAKTPDLRFSLFEL
jgi:hypothetical protein